MNRPIYLYHRYISANAMIFFLGYIFEFETEKENRITLRRKDN